MAAELHGIRTAAAVDRHDEQLVFNRSGLIQYAPVIHAGRRPGRRHKNNLRPVSVAIRTIRETDIITNHAAMGMPSKETRKPLFPA